MRILFLDDNPNRTRLFLEAFPDADTVETATACISHLEMFEYDVLYLDHDLGGKEWVSSEETNTGMEVVRWMESAQPPLKQVIVHSWNTVAGPIMAHRLRDVGYLTTYQPFGGIFKGHHDDKPRPRGK